VKELPSGWVNCSFRELGETRLGKMLDKQKNTGTPVRYLRNINVRWFNFDLSDLQTIFLSEGELKVLSVKDGDLLICEGGEPGRAAVWRGGENDLTFQKALHRLRVGQGIVPELLMYRLRADSMSGELAKSFTGTTIKHLTGEGLARHRTTLPPAAEQGRIVARLSSVIAQVDACQIRLDRVNQILKKFREAVLEAAISGRLTEEWRQGSLGESALTENSKEVSPPSWQRMTIGDCVSELIGGASPSESDYTVNGVLVLNKGDIKTYGKVEPKKGEKRTSKAFASKHLNKIVGQNALLATLRDLSTKADFLGLIGLYEGNEDALITQGMYWIRPNNNVIDQYLMYYSNSPVYRDIVKREKIGATQVHLRNGQFLGIPIPLPPVTEQREIVRRVRDLFTIADSFERRAADCNTMIEAFTPSVLAKAFHGKLVPQDPSDESAGALLDRIKREREEIRMVTKKKVSRRMGRAAVNEASDRVKAVGHTEKYTLTPILKKQGRLRPEALLQSSGLGIDEFYDQLKIEEAKGLLKEVRKGKNQVERWIEAVK